MKIADPKFGLSVVLTSWDFERFYGFHPEDRSNSLQCGPCHTAKELKQYQI
jgi:hypothetical protein